MVAESWFRTFWKHSRKHEGGGSGKAVIGVLAFEVASLMNKLVHLWQTLSDKQISRLRTDITNSVGIRKLISEDEEFIGGLICAEMMESLESIAKSIARLGKKCGDASLKCFDHAFGELLKVGADPCEWVFSSKKMEKKVKKMETFISLNASLYQEMEILADFEQTFKRMKCTDTEPENLLAFQKKVAWKKHEVKTLREISIWNRTYDYTVLLLARSVFTTFNRIKHVFGISHKVNTVDFDGSGSDFIDRSHSVSGFLQSAGPSFETNLPRFASGPLGRFTPNSGPIQRSNKMSDFLSGPLSAASAKSSPTAKTNKFKFYSGPLGKIVTKSDHTGGSDKFSKKPWQTHDTSAIFSKKQQHAKQNRLTQVGPFKGCLVSTDAIINTGNFSQGNNALHANQWFNPRRRLLDAPANTLGGVALALHYANLIVVIEKLSASPHLIGNDARDDLYYMLPGTIKSALREKLKPYSKRLDSSIYDMRLAKKWSEAMTLIFDWLAPLAHNMIRWQSERSYEQQSLVSRTNVVLVQTLYFADQEKTEATITELLVGLNYICGFGRELNAKALQECASSRLFD